MFSFHLFGFKCHVQTGFLFLVGIVFLFGLRNQQPLLQMAGTVGVFFVSILVHELGHAFASRWFRVPVEGIYLHGFGGHVLHGQSSVGQGLAISLAGPFSGLALGALSIALYMVAQNPFAASVLEVSIFVNIFWSLFNLAPMIPLDGGHATLAGLSLVLPRRTAATITLCLGIATGLALVFAGWQTGFLIAAFFAGSFAFQNVQMLLQHNRAGLRGAEEG